MATADEVQFEAARGLRPGSPSPRQIFFFAASVVPRADRASASTGHPMNTPPDQQRDADDEAGPADGLDLGDGARRTKLTGALVCITSHESLKAIRGRDVANGRTLARVDGDAVCPTARSDTRHARSVTQGLYRRKPPRRHDGRMTTTTIIEPAGIAVLLGHLLTADSIGPAIGGTTALLGLLGGVWFPITSGALHVIAQALPSYWLVQAAHVGLGGDGWGITGWLVVIAWSVGAGLLAMRAYRRDTEKPSA